jgi:hypothetical protein
MKHRWLIAIAVLITIFLTYSLLRNRLWYKSGLGESNCGPTCVAMAIKWATGKNFSDIEIRKEIGYDFPGSGTDLQDLVYLLGRHDVAHNILSISTPEELGYFVHNDQIAIVSIDTKYIEKAGLFSSKGRNYNLDGYHWIIVTEIVAGYFEVLDPISGGRNRFYSIGNLWKALLNRQIILIKR